jgi:hypothetical protein
MATELSKVITHSSLVRGLIRSRGQCKVQTSKSCQLFVWPQSRLHSTKRAFQVLPLIPITSIWSCPEECKWLPTEPLFETSDLEHQDGGPSKHDASRLSAVSFLLVSCQRLLVPRYAATTTTRIGKAGTQTTCCNKVLTVVLKPVFLPLSASDLPFGGRSIFHRASRFVTVADHERRKPEGTVVILILAAWWKPPDSSIHSSRLLLSSN